MNRLVLPAILAMALMAHAEPQELGQLDSSPTLFTVMAAINAAGYDAELASPNNHPLRDEIRAVLAKKNIPSLPALKEFFQTHKQRTGTEELSHYISFGLTAGPPPRFAITKRDVEIPPDVTSMSELPGLLEAFYKEADIADLWRRSQPAVDRYIEWYHKPVVDAVFTVNAYLRQQTSGFHGRRFQIFIELQAAPNQIQTRSYGEQYFVVIAPSPEPRAFDIRHAYLHYLLDPLATRYQEILNRKKPLMDHAKRARALPETFKDDFLLLATESLIKSIEARLDHKPETIQQALQQGYILAPFFSEQLGAFEKQDQGMLLYYPQMVAAIDNYKENTRLTMITFDNDAVTKVVPVVRPAAPPALMGVAKTLDDGEQAYSKRDLAKAKKFFLIALDQTQEKPQQAAAYYGLGRVALLEKDPEGAEKLLLRAKDLEPDAFVRGWVLVYLGKLSAAANERMAAIAYFNDVLKLPGASDKARSEAAKSLQDLK